MASDEAEGHQASAKVFKNLEHDEPTTNFVEDFTLFESFGAGSTRPSSPTDITTAKSQAAATPTSNGQSSKSPEAAIGSLAQACDSMAQATIDSREWFRFRPDKPHEVLDKVLFEPNFHKQKQKIAGVTQILKSFERSLFNNNPPTGYRDFGLDEAVKALASILGWIQRQEDLPPSVLAASATKIEVPEHTSVDSLEAVADMLDAIADVVGLQSAKSSDPPVLAISAGGRNVGCDGPIAFLTILVIPLAHIYIFDLSTLPSTIFHHLASTYSLTIGTLLASSTLSKFLYDSRHIAAALYHHHSISLAGVVDIQLLNLATTQRGKQRRLCLPLAMPPLHSAQFPVPFVSTWNKNRNWAGLMVDVGIEEAERRHEAAGGWWGRPCNRTAAGTATDATTSDAETQTETETQESSSDASLPACQATHAPSAEEDGQVPDALAQRPLHPWLLNLCIGSVSVLPRLHAYFTGHKYWNQTWGNRVRHETLRRLERSREEDGGVRDESKAPKGWDEVAQVDRALGDE